MRSDRRQDTVGSSIVALRGLRVLQHHHILDVIQCLDLPSRRELVLVRAIVLIRNSGGGVIIRRVVRRGIQRIVASCCVRIRGCQHLRLRALVAAMMIRQQSHDRMGEVGLSSAEHTVNVINDVSSIEMKSNFVLHSGLCSQNRFLPERGFRLSCEVKFSRHCHVSFIGSSRYYADV